MMQPASRLLVAISVPNSDKCHSGLRYTIAPLITAMSKPNNSPDVAATAQTK